jgi:hypothetical protein
MMEPASNTQAPGKNGDNDYGLGVAVDAANNVVMLGVASNFFDRKIRNTYLAKYAAEDGSLLWQKVIGPDKRFDDYFSPRPFPPMLTPDGGIVVPQYAGDITKFIRPADPVHRVVYATGDPVPEFGIVGEPHAATWSGFGVPMINDVGRSVSAGFGEREAGADQVSSSMDSSWQKWGTRPGASALYR